MNTSAREIPDALEELSARKMRSLYGTQIIRASDRVAEQLASARDQRQETDHLLDTLLELWRLRWELCLLPSAVGLTQDESEGQ